MRMNECHGIILENIKLYDHTTNLISICIIYNKINWKINKYHSRREWKYG